MRRLRIAIGVLSLLGILIYGLDLHSLIPDRASRWLLWFQFTPSALKLSMGDMAAGFSVLLILLITMLWGRIYCSFLCPLGIMFDCISRLKRKRRYKFKPANPARYIFLAAAIIPLLMGSLLTVTLLDPYANFARLSAELFRPAAILINNSAAMLMEKAGNYSIPPIPYRGYILPVLVFILAYAALVTALALRSGRTYCNLICPLGALLGFVARAGLYKFKISDKCTGCGRCERICKASCIDLQTREIDASRCVSCFNCESSCPEGAVSLKKMRRKASAKSSGPTKIERRVFLQKTFALPGLFFATPKKTPDTSSIIPTGRSTTILPPGAGSMARYASLCTGCHTCVARCPSQVLQPSLFELGQGKPLLPHLNPDFGFCNYQCTSCSKVCPNGAILPLDLKTKQLTQIGQVKLEIENCIVRTRKTDCGACAEHCPTKAVSMKPKGKLKEPTITPETCIGCGACEFICPSRPFRAIWVEGNSVQKQAEKPDFGKLKTPAGKDDFPF